MSSKAITTLKSQRVKANLLDFVGPQSWVFSKVQATLQSALFVSRSIGRSVGHTLISFMILFL